MWGKSPFQKGTHHGNIAGWVDGSVTSRVVILSAFIATLTQTSTFLNLMHLQLSDIPDKKERDKSLLLVQKLFTLLGKQIHRSNLSTTIICGVRTFIASIVPIATYLVLPPYYNSAVSLILVSKS
jgi:hypothetical protein